MNTKHSGDQRSLQLVVQPIDNPRNQQAVAEKSEDTVVKQQRPIEEKNVSFLK